LEGAPGRKLEGRASLVMDENLRRDQYWTTPSSMIGDEEKG